MRLQLAVAAAVLLALPALARADGDVRAESGAMLATMRGDAQRIAALLAQARHAGTPEQRRCVDVRLSEADAAVRAGRDDVASVRAATAAGNATAVQHAMVGLSAKREAARAAVFGADACLAPPGATMAPRDQTVVRVIVDPTLPSDSTVFGH